MKSQTFDHTKMYDATLTDGLSFNLGLRRFVKDVPQKVTGEIAEILSKKGFAVDVKKSKNVVDAAWQPYFTITETDEDVPEGADISEGTIEEEEEERTPLPPVNPNRAVAAPPKAKAESEQPRGTRTVRRASTK